MAKISININKGQLIASDVVVGIDLGTTNSLVAYVNKDTHLPICVGIAGETIVPSVIKLSESGKVIVGEEAKKSLILAPESTIFSVKRLLGKNYKDLEAHADYFTYRIVDDVADQLLKVVANDKYYTPVQLSSFILAELKYRAEKVLGKVVQRAVITVPAYFNDSQRQATRDAGKLAGLDVLRIINEPTAASLAYGIGLTKEDDKTILVYDLGGGTFDVSILRIQDGVFEVLSTHGDTYLGGDDIDRSIVNYWLESHNWQLNQLSRELVQELRLTAENAKIIMSNGEKSFSSTIQIFGKEESLELQPYKFEDLVAPLVERTLKSIGIALKDAGLTAEGIQEVVLVGGSTRLPQVKRAIIGIFGKVKTNDTLDPDEVVALGAAIEADILAGNRRDLLLLDVTPLSLGIETAGGLMDVILPRNSKIPGKAGRQYTTSVDGQVNMKIAVYQGERELVTENRKLAEFELRGIPAMPAGLPKVDISFLVDADGILKVSAQELRSGIKTDIAIKPQYGLTDEMVEVMLKESMLNAKSDMEMRMLLEAKTEGRQLMYTAERFIDNNKELLSELEFAQTQKYIQELKDSFEFESRDDILKHIDTLNEYTRPFAERLMDMAVGKALKGTVIK